MAKNGFYEISYEDAKEFLDNLPEEKLTEFYKKYNISEPLQDPSNGNEVSEKEQLVMMISDDDLISLGYKDDNITNDDQEEKVGYAFDDVVDFLEGLNEDTLSDLMREYYAYDVEELATAITDADLKRLGIESKGYTNIEAPSFKKLEKEWQYFQDATDKLYENGVEYKENLDYLEDVDNVPYAVIDEEQGVFSVPSEYDFLQFKEKLDRNLVDTCDICDEQLDGSSVVFKVVPHNYEVSEEVVINTELNPAIFDSEHKMLPETKEKLLNYVDTFIEKMKEKSIDVDYTDIQLVGSNAGYLYTPESDIDIHFIWSKPMDKDNFEQIKDEFALYTTENPMTIGNNNVELNLEDDFNIIAAANRRYSLLDDVWVDDSDKNEVYTQDDMVSVEGYEDLVDDYVQRIDDVVDNDLYADAVDLKHEIRQNRSRDLTEIGALSLGNVVFKELRNNGAYGKLRTYLKSKEEVTDE
mgnify:CR=1 FL=1